MKTTKRFLSIVLMLAMLVSMFTVMAFADDSYHSVTVDLKIENAEGGKNGKVIYTGTQEEITTNTTIGTWDDRGFVAQPAQGYTASWETENKDVSINGNEVSLKGTSGRYTLKVKFVEVSEKSTTEANVDIIIVKGEGADGTVKYSDEYPVSNGSKITLKDNKSETLTAYPEVGCTVSWQLDNAPAIPGSTYTLKELKADATLTVTFTKTTPAETKTLRLVAETVSGKTYGKVKYGSSVDTYIEKSVEVDKKITVEAIANRGYEFVRWESDEVTLTDNQKSSAELTFTMPNKEAKVTAVFTTKSNYDYKNTLTLSVSGSRHGDVFYRYADERTYEKAENGKVWNLSNDDLVIRLSPDSGYEVVWQIDNGRKYYGEDFVLNLDDIDAEYGSTLYVSFVEKGCRPDYDDDSHTLTIDITGEKHGTVKRGTTKIYDGYTMSLEKNDTRTFKATPDKGYVAVWTFRGESYVGNEFTVKMGSKNATLYIEFMDEDDYRLWNLPFRDVSERDWFYSDVAYVYANGYMEGISSTKFAPKQNTTRAQIVTILWRLTGEPRPMKSNKFTDVSSKAYYDTAVSWAVEAGVVNGFDAKTFKPNDYVTREQLAAILYRYAEYMNLSTRGASNLSNYNDYYKIGSWARDAMAWANYHGLINGVSYSRIDPKGYATRAQIAAILHRFAVEFGNY